MDKTLEASNSFWKLLEASSHTIKAQNVLNEYNSANQQHLLIAQRKTQLKALKSLEHQ